MTISILLMKQIAQLFLMIFMGYLIVKTGIVEDTDSKVLSKIILYLVIPCVIINAFQVDYTSDTVKGLLLAFIAAFVKCYCIYFLKKFQFFNFIQFSFKIMQIFYCARSQSVLNYIVVATSTKPLNFSSFKGSF